MVGTAQNVSAYPFVTAEEAASMKYTARTSHDQSCVTR